MDFHYPLPSVSNFNIFNKDPSLVTTEAKEAIHIQRLDPNLNRNIGKMSIPHCFDQLISTKPKHSQEGLLSQVQDSVDEIAPLSQITGLNLTHFTNIGTFRPNLIKTYPNTQPEPVGLKTYRIEFFAKLKNQTIGWLFNT